MDSIEQSFTSLLAVVKELRKKCPWDKEQTWESLRTLTIEECHELTDSILSQNKTEIKKELGDVLLHILFYSVIGEEEQAFTIKEVMDSLKEKLIKRHPHIYGEVSADTAEKVKENWENIKLKEGNKSVLSGVPKSLPSIIKAQRLQEKASSVGFDWDNKDQVWGKVQEELQEYKEADADNKPKEFGDLLFSLINYARFENINPDNALELTNQKFIDRFKLMEEKINIEGKQLSNMNLSEMDIYWEEAKIKLNNQNNN